MTTRRNPAEAPLLVVLVGPTASGKTALSLSLAEHLNGEIVSCDSVAVYRGMDIGSAKPTRAEQARVPHHLLDVTTPATEYTAGDYGRAARAAVHDIASRGRTPIVAGGTGLYLRALLDGLSPMPARNEALRDRLRRISSRETAKAGQPLIADEAQGSATSSPDAAAGHGKTPLHRLLTRFDPSAAATIHPNDTPKLIRALEVTLLARRPLTEAWQQQRPEPLTGFRIAQFGLAPPRAELYERINHRCAGMFENGLLEETRSLIAEYGPDRRALNALGYAQAVALLAPGSAQAADLASFVQAREPARTTPPNEADALAATRQGHRNYAKRQGTWFRKDPRIHWVPGSGETALAEVLAQLSASGLR